MEMVVTEVEVDDLTGGELLDHAAALAETRNRCEVEILKVAVQHAYLNDPDALRASRPDGGVPVGGERAKQLGGPGTPHVCEFAAAELGARLGMSTVSAALLMGDGLDIRHRLPQLWAQVVTGRVRVHLARLVARKTRSLAPEQAAFVDSRVAGYADGRLTWSRFQALVDGAVAAADPAATAVAEEKALAAQFARPTRVEERDGGPGDPAGHGVRGFYIRAPFATIAVFDAAVARIADILGDLGDTDNLEHRRVKALLVLSRPDVAAELVTAYQAWRDRPDDPTEADPEPRTGPTPVLDWKVLLPRVVIHTHVYAGRDADPVARVERCGAMSLAWVTRHLTAAAQVTIRPVLDLAGQAPVDSYEIPERHRQAVRIMTPADTFPYASSLHPDQIDHTRPFRRGPDRGAGQSRIGNYGALTTHHHRIKTHGRWQVRQPFAGIYLWRDPHGRIYLVDHTGTRVLTGAA